MVDLLVPTSLDQLIFILKCFFTLLKKQATLTRRSTVLSFPLQLVFPGETIQVSEGKSAACFCCQVAAWFPDMFCNFYLVKKMQFAKNLTTNKVIEKLST